MCATHRVAATLKAGRGTGIHRREPPRRARKKRAKRGARGRAKGQQVNGAGSAAPTARRADGRQARADSSGA
eukprot:823788-Pleurochrysis_carterae.AAC.1